MRSRARDSEVFGFIKEAMPTASVEEQLQATHECWEFIDAIWAIADRLVSEREAIEREEQQLPHHQETTLREPSPQLPPLLPE
ncbi:MAG: hypothetical protein AB3X44_10985 [Leptothrix sp. (in: b-proteobacteria)]